MKIQVLGTGCHKCTKLTEAVEAAAQEIGLDYELEKVTEIKQILELNVMMTPALAIDGEVMLLGKVATIDELKNIFSNRKEVS